MNYFCFWYEVLSDFVYQKQIAQTIKMLNIVNNKLLNDCIVFVLISINTAYTKEYVDLLVVIKDGN